MRTFGLTGYPLAHSFSAEWFGRKFAAEGITDVQYLNFPIEDGALLPELLAKADIFGLNVTVPYKERIIPFLDELSPEAAAIGAVNCVVRERCGWVGYNTDRQAFEESLTGFLSKADSGILAEDEIYMPEMGGKSVSRILSGGNIKALILGSGGAAKAAACALDRVGIEYAVVSRGADILHETKVECMPCGVVGAAGGQAWYGERKEYSGQIKMADSKELYKFGRLRGYLNHARMLRYEDIGREVLDSHRLIINATPLGMFPDVKGKPAIPYGLLTTQHFLYDMVYNPPLTAFLAEGQRQGCHVKNGLEMLHRQAELSWRLFFNGTIPF